MNREIRATMRVESNKSGFTMLEMLVTIAIFALIMGMSVGGYDRMKRQARSHQCASNLRHLGVSLNLYMGDHNLVFPTLAPARDDKNDDEKPTLDTVLLEYANSEDAFRCPGDNQGHWEKSGCSYFWNSLVNGQALGNMSFMGLTRNEAGIPLIADKENFHRSIGDEVNILYADGHVVSELQFTVDR